MLKRIELKNFMSHKHSVIEPAEGLTVLIGPNNCGKSAVVLALQILCYNDKSKYVTRHGESECSVKVETDDGHVVEWIRKRSPSYFIDGAEYNRLAQAGMPVELHQGLRLPKVETEGDETFDVHFGEQKEPVFLLDKPPSRAARFFASSSDAIQLIKMQELHRSNVTQDRRRETELEAFLTDLDGVLEILKPVIDLDKRLEIIETNYSNIYELSKNIISLATDIANYEGLNEKLNHDEVKMGLLAALESPPILELTGALEELIADLEYSETDFVYSEMLITAFRGLETPPLMHDVDKLQNDIKTMCILDQTCRQHENTSKSMQGLQPPPNIKDVGILAKNIVELGKVGSRIRDAQKDLDVLNNVEPPPYIEDYSELERLIKQLTETQKNVGNLMRDSEIFNGLDIAPDLADIKPLSDSVIEMDELTGQIEIRVGEIETSEKELDEVMSKIRAWALENKVCPTCGMEVAPEDLIEQTIRGYGEHYHG